LGVGDWGWGIGDWAQPPIPNPQSPIPNPHFVKNDLIFVFKIQQIKFLKFKIKLNGNRLWEISRTII